MMSSSMMCGGFVFRMTCCYAVLLTCAHFNLYANNLIFIIGEEGGGGHVGLLQVV